MTTPAGVLVVGAAAGGLSTVDSVALRADLLTAERLVVGPELNWRNS